MCGRVVPESTAISENFGVGWRGLCKEPAVPQNLRNSTVVGLVCKVPSVSVHRSSFLDEACKRRCLTSQDVLRDFEGS